MQGERIRHLLSSDVKNFNGAREDRTPDLVTASHALSQLSYGPTMEGVTEDDELKE